MTTATDYVELKEKLRRAFNDGSRRALVAELRPQAQRTRRQNTQR